MKFHQQQLLVLLCSFTFLAVTEAPLPEPEHSNGLAGIIPNMNPIKKPPRESEQAGILDLIMNGVESLPNTWKSRPNYRFPYYDKNGRGYPLYGYGDYELFEYSEFDWLEGWY